MSNGPFIYLAGPILGCTEGEAKDWRSYVGDALAPYGIKTVSPLRCEPLTGERYQFSEKSDLCFGDPRAILAKNFLDLRMCDMTLAYFPQPDNPSTQRSAGTMGEVAWSYALQKPCAVVTNDPFIKQHPFTSCQPSWPLLPTLDDAIRLIQGIFAVYSR